MNTARKLLLSALALSAGLATFAAPAGATSYGPWHTIFTGTETALTDNSDGGNFYPSIRSRGAEYKVTFSGHVIAQSLAFGLSGCTGNASGGVLGHGTFERFEHVRLPATYYVFVPAALGLCGLLAGGFSAAQVAQVTITIAGRAPTA